MRNPRKLILGIVLVATVAAISVRIWRQEIRTAARDFRYPPTGAQPQDGSLAARFNARHQHILSHRNDHPIDVLFLGDSITEFWEIEGAADWAECFAPLNAANFGVSTDATQHLLWRITDGQEIDGLSPKVVVLMIGTNNTTTNSASAIAGGVEKILRMLRAKLPKSKILLLSLLPRELGGDVVNIRTQSTNTKIAALADGQWIQYLEVHDRFLDEHGRPSAELLHDGLHLSAAGYQVLADAVRPKLDTMLRDP